MKQLFAIAFFLFSSLAHSQGLYTYQPVDVEITLPLDTALQAKIEREGALVSASVFEKDFAYHVNFVRSHPEIFKRKAVIPYLEAYPSLKAVYGEGLIQDLSGLSPLPVLKLDSRLLAIARLHAADLGKNNLMSHQSSNGITTQQRFEKVGVSCGTECINMGNFPNALEVLLSLLIDYKVANAGHRKSLLNPKMNSIGVGTARNKSGEVQYTVADLGCD